MPRGIFLTGKDVMILEACSTNMAYRILTTIRDALGKPTGTKITLKEYASYRGIDVAEVKEALK